MLEKTRAAPYGDSEGLVALQVVDRIHLLVTQVVRELNAWVERSARTWLECRLSQSRRLLCDVDILQGANRTVFLLVPIIDEVTVRPMREVGVLEVGELEPLKGAAVVVDAVAEHVWQFQLLALERVRTGCVWVPKRFKYGAPERGVP